MRSHQASSLCQPRLWWHDLDLLEHLLQASRMGAWLMCCESLVAMGAGLALHLSRKDLEELHIGGLWLQELAEQALQEVLSHGPVVDALPRRMEAQEQVHEAQGGHDVLLLQPGVVEQVGVLLEASISAVLEVLLSIEAAEAPPILPELQVLLHELVADACRSVVNVRDDPSELPHDTCIVVPDLPADAARPALAGLDAVAYVGSGAISACVGHGPALAGRLAGSVALRGKPSSPEAAHWCPVVRRSDVTAKEPTRGALPDAPPRGSVLGALRCWPAPLVDQRLPALLVELLLGLLSGSCTAAAPPAAAH